MEATSALYVYGDYDVVMQGASELEIEFDPYVEMSGTSEFYATGNGVGYGGGRSYLPTISGRGGYDNPGYGEGVSELPVIFTNGEGGHYIPPATTIGLSYLPYISGSGVLIRSRAGGGVQFLPTMDSRGGDFLYGVGEATLQPLVTFGMYGLDRLEANMVDYLLIGTGIAAQHVLHVVFISDGTISDTISLTRIQSIEFLSQLNQSDTMSVLGTFTQSFIDNLTIESRHGENVITGSGYITPALDSEGMVWVVNIDTGASSQYEQYGFNSFFERDGEAYGVADNGIYRLEGDTDAGLQISALADFGKSNFGTSFKKKCPYVYLGVGSDGSMYLKVDADEQTYVYEMRNNSEAIENHRVDVGKGLQGNYWNFTLMNRDGADFDLDSIQFEPIVSSRRIK